MLCSVDVGLLLLLICSCMIRSAHFQPHCPLYCSTCQPNYISCKSGGLLSIPFQLQSATEKIILSNQLLFHGVLTKDNFSELAPPRFYIKYLSIRSSSIQELRQKTFANLPHLEFLDLSENQRLTIVTQAFYGLKLNLLKLDDIGKLMLSKGSFQNLTTDVLSMKNSRLQSLNFDMFDPLLFTLKHLFIENNQIRTLDQRFERLFQRLEIVNLKDNPLICYCPLLWLKRVLTSKIKSNKYKDNIYDSSIETDIFPKCVAPSYLRNRQLQSISDGEFNCQIPRISFIEIDLISPQIGEMTCKIDPEDKSHKIPTKIFWEETQVIEEQRERFRRNSGMQNNRMLSEYSDAIDSAAKIKISSESVSTSRIFKCIAQNTAGKSMIRVRISWPTILSLNKGLVVPNNETILMTSLDVSGEYIVPKSYLFTKQYTFLEMSVAIVVTFFITVLIFLLCYKCVFSRKNSYKSGKPSYKYSVHAESPNLRKRSLIAIHNQVAGYTIYEAPMQYSDSSQTYESLPHNSVHPHPHAYPQQQQQLLSNSPSAHFIDYKTHKKLSSSSKGHEGRRIS